MKRDMDLVRTMLIQIEATDRVDLTSAQRGHLELLKQTGFVVIDEDSTLSDVRYALTWTGHEFLDQIRKDKVWEWIKTRSLDALGVVSIESVKTLGPLAVQHFLKSPPA